MHSSISDDKAEEDDDDEVSIDAEMASVGGGGRVAESSVCSEEDNVSKPGKSPISNLIAKFDAKDQVLARPKARTPTMKSEVKFTYSKGEL